MHCIHGISLEHGASERRSATTTGLKVLGPADRLGAFSCHIKGSLSVIRLGEFSQCVDRIDLVRETANMSSKDSRDAPYVRLVPEDPLRALVLLERS